MRWGLRGWAVRGIVAAGLTATALSAAAAPPATPIAPFDWQVIVVTAGPHGAHDVEIIQSLTGSSTDNDQVAVLGVGMPAEQVSFGFSVDNPWYPDAPAVTTTKQLGGVHLSLVAQNSKHWVSTGVGSLVESMAPGEQMAFLFGQAHTDLSVYSLVRRAKSG